MSRSITRRLDAQLRKIIKDNNEYYTCWMDTEDVKIWYALIKNLPEPYEKGEFLFKLIIPDDFPDNPPSLIALTPNGLLEMGGKICVSVGEFHSNDHYKTNSRGQYGWIPSLGIGGFILQGVVNALLSFTGSEQGVRLNNQPDYIKKELAKNSKQFNIDNNSYISQLLDIHRECFPTLKIW